jgi:hypothetical protein
LVWQTFSTGSEVIWLFMVFEPRCGAVVVRSPRFEPGSSAWQSINQGAFTEISVNWGDYEDFLKKNHCLQNTKDLVSDTRKFSWYLLTNNFSEMQKLTDALRARALRCLANFSKYLGCYEEFQKQRKAYGLSWVSVAKDDVIINRLLKTQNADDLFTWMIDAKFARPDLALLIDFMATTGLRPGEAFNSYNLIIELSKQGLLYGKYLNPQTKFLEHFRFKNTFIRRSKKAFISYAPEKIVEAIQDQEQLKSLDGTIKRLDNEKIHSRFSDLRELYASFMTQWLTPAEIDFLQGRITARIFMANYYNPQLVQGLTYRIDQGTTEILNKIS